MKSIALYLLLAISLLPNLLHSQISIEGKLALGDTSQLLIMETKNGDQFTGNLISWDASRLVFRMTTGDTLRVDPAKVKGLRVQDKASFPNQKKLVNGTFFFYEEGDLVWQGELIEWNQQGTRLRYGKKGREFIPSRKLEKVEFSADASPFQFENRYILRLRNTSGITGRLEYLDQESVYFQPLDGPVYQYDLSQVNNIKPFRQMTAPIGHQRALLLTPTGFNLSKGQNEFRNINYVLNSLAIGLTDHLSATVGLLGVEPYIQMKASHDLGRFLHLSAGAGVTITGTTGWFTAASVGVPDLYLNMGYMRNKGETSFSETDMDAIFFGVSSRVGMRQRLYGEFTYIVEQEDLFDTNGFGTNTFAFGWGFIGRIVSLNIGLMMMENVDRDFCFNGSFFAPCNDELYNYIPVPVISTSIFFNKDK